MIKLFPFIAGLALFVGASVLLSDSDSTWGARLSSEEKVDASSAPAQPPAKKMPDAAPAAAPPPPRSPAPPSALSQSELSPVTMNFIDTDIRELIRLISERTGKNFIVDERVKGKVTVIAPKPISPEMAYRVFLSILEVHGFNVIPSGDVYKIVPSLFARHRATETYDGRAPSEVEKSDVIITQLIPLQFADAEQVKNLLTPLVAKESVILSYPDNNMIIITDVASNIDRLLKIIREIDIEGLIEKLHIVQLKYAKASEMAYLITSLVPATGQPAAVAQPPAPPRPATPFPFTRAGRVSRQREAVKVIAEDRTNILIILTGPKDIEMIMELIAKLDIETPKGRGKVHVYYLSNADAEDLARTLTQLPIQRAQQPAARAPAAPRIPTPAAPAARPGAAPAPIIEGVNITSHKATNSLIITATPEDYEMLISVIEKLDIPRLQVFIEALFVEISDSRRLDLGVEWSAFGHPTIGAKEGIVGGGLIGPTPSNLSGILGAVSQGSQPAFPTGFSLGVLGETFKFGDVTITSLAALINLLKSMSNTNILSAPQLLTMDNEEAKIIVSTNVPFTVSADVDATNINRTVRTFAYRDVGVTLQITPSITKNKFIRLKLFQEVSSLVSAVTGTGATAELAPTTLKRQAETVVVVKDTSTIVIGGLIGEQMGQTETMAPCIGELPWVGWLFRNTSRQRDKTNLYIFLTPHIVDTQEKAQSIYEEKHKSITKDRMGKPQPSGLEKLLDKEGVGELSLPAPRKAPPVNEHIPSGPPSAVEPPPARSDSPSSEGR